MFKTLFRLFSVITLSLFFVFPAWSQSKTKIISLEPNLSLQRSPIAIEKLLPTQTFQLYSRPNPKGLEDAFPNHLDLSENLGVVGKERDQGNCGSCWVWAGIGCLEGQFNKALREGIFEDVNYVANQKFSINFVEGKIKKYNGSSWTICNGGNPETFADLVYHNDIYNYLVPKANHNADATFSGLPDDTNTTNDFQLIQKDPHVDLNNFQLLNVVSDYENHEQAKYEIIGALNDGYLVQADYYFYNDFYDFWNNKDESEQYIFPDKMSGSMDGHAVIIVGYDISDSDPSKHYWLVQNSWGVSEKRPKGQFRFNINAGFKPYSIFEFVIYKSDYGVGEEVCDNLDNDCNTVIDDNCEDYCPDDDEKTVPGACGCGISDFDGDEDGTPDCLDGCPEDQEKTKPGICGCGIEDSIENISDEDENGIVNCQEDDFNHYKEIKFSQYFRTTTPYFYEEEHKKLDSSSGRLCALTTKNDLYCMGDNTWGEIGNGTRQRQNALVRVENIKNVTDYSLGDNHTCAIANSKVYCWGFNRTGELGRGNGSDDVWGPIVADETGIRWDENAISLFPTEIEYNIESPDSVTCGTDATCVTTKTGGAYCFGRNEGGKLGIKGWMFPFRKAEIRFLEEGSMCYPKGWDDLSGTIMFNGITATVPLPNISDIAMSHLETVAISDGKLYNYGLHHDLKSYPVAARYDEFKNLVAVSKSETDLCAINSDGELYCLDTFVSSHFSPELHKVGSVANKPRADYPVQKIPLENVSMVSCGSSIMNFMDLCHSAENSEEENNDCPAYNYGLTCDIDPPFVEKDGSLIGGTVYGYPYSTDTEAHICAVSNGDLYCWGRKKDDFLEQVGTNTYGQLGSSYRVLDYDTPKKVEGVSNVTALATSGGITCYITNGEIFCFGDLIPLGIDRQGPKPCRLTKANSKVADFIQAGDVCEYVGGGCGKYSYRNGNYICKPCAEEVEYAGGLEDIPNCLDDLGTNTDIEPTVEPTSEPTVDPTTEPTSEPTVEPTPEPTVEPEPPLCPAIIPTSIQAKKAGKKIVVTMEEIDRNCFEGTYFYQVELKKNKKLVTYKTKNTTLKTKNLKKGKYKVSYRVMKQIRKKVKVKVKVKGKTKIKYKYKNVLRSMSLPSKIVIINIK